MDTLSLEGYIYDHRLGYVRDGCTLTGFDVYGEDDAPGGRIVTLGGYTTPEQAQTGKSWAEHLYNRLDGKYQVLSGCTDGYTSAQILTIFIREVILFKPKLVVCLSGFFNIAYKLGLVESKEHAQILAKHPFTTPRQIEFLRKITSRFGLGNEEVFYGEENNLSAAEYWFTQMEMLRCLCGEFGIKLMSFVQPCVFSGVYNRCERESSAIRGKYGISDSETCSFRSQFQETYTELRGISKDADYIVDISNIFDSKTDVYADACHVKDGNIARIAEAILSQMKSEGFDI